MVAGIVVGVIVVLVGAGWYLLYRRPLPLVSGTITVPGLDAPVRIDRDGRGVPHVQARSARDAAFAMGYAHAQDRGWQLEFNRRVASGRVSEFAGDEGVATDRFMRRLGLRRVVEAELALLDDEVRGIFEAYAAGINAVWSSGRPLPLELTLLRIRPEPWRPADSLMLAKLLHLGLALNMDNELRRVELLRRLGPEKAAKLDFLYDPGNPSILVETARSTAAAAGDLTALYHEAATWFPTGGVAAASNNWVVDGTMTETGRPMLCNDPHLPASVPSVWYQAHLVAGDDFESAGVTMPGLAFPLIGHNRRIAWGYTNSFADVQDLVIEELSDRSGRQYRTEDGMADAEVHREVIRVKGRPDVVEDVVVTRHGPLMERWEDRQAGVWRGLALQWTALTPGEAARSILELQRAGDWEAFRDAMARIDGPSQNVVYADVDGHIGYFLCGRIPVRRYGKSNGLPVVGWTGEAMWKGWLGKDEVPQVLDPAEHFVVTANNRVVGDDFPHYISIDYMNGYRAARLRELLQGRTGLNATYMATTQLDVVCIPAREVVSLLQGVKCESELAEEARQNLLRWDAVLDPEAAEPCVYEAFMRRLTQHALEPLCGADWRLASGDMAHPVFGLAGNLIGGITPHLLRRWRENDTDWFPDGVSWAQVAARAMEDAVTDLRRMMGGPRRWRWGRLHRLPVDHVLGRRRPLTWLFNAGSVEVGGDTDTVMQTAYIPSEPFRTKAWSPSWRQIMDVGNWDACTGVHFPGQSGHPGSRHYRDLFADWHRNRQHPLPWSPEAVAAATRSTLLLSPGPVAAVAPAESVGKVAA